MALTGYERNKRWKARKKGLLPPVEPAMTTLERNRKYKYGIDRKNFNELIIKQDYKCAICKNKIDEKCCVDHSHETGKIRGLLCDKCNRTLGHIEGINLNNFIEYLKNN